MKNRILLTGLLVAIATILAAQTEKAAAGAIPRPVGAIRNPQSAIDNSTAATYAVVIGISDYQSPAIQDLAFAHRDAEAFADWLQSPAGGSVPADHIQLLLDDNATTGRVDAAMGWLIDAAEEGDMAVLYFSGHGDIETKTRTQLGFLLCWNSPPSNYIAGSIPVFYFQEIISTLSIEKKARVMVVTDACHAGKLAGAGVGGSSLTSANLARQIAGEVKFLACQPEELSLESTQWGGGRGVFSYYFVDGLTGFADTDEDGMVTVYEMDRYLGAVVPEQTAPQIQIPMVLGNRQTVLSRVDAGALVALKKSRSSTQLSLNMTGTRGTLESLIPPTDSVALRLYHDFEQALEQGRLLDDQTRLPSADALFRQSAGLESLRPLQNIMRRNLAAALQDEVQQTLNALLESDPYEVTHWRINPEKYTDYPRFLERAMELLGQKHFMYPVMASKKLYFEAYLLLRNVANMELDPDRREAAHRRVRGLLYEAISLQPQAAYLYHAVANTYHNNTPPQTDSLTAYCQKAMEFAPQWLLPYLDIAYEYHVSQNDYRSGEKWLLKAYEYHPESYVVLERMAWLRQWQNRSGEALDICRKMIANRPDLFGGYATMGFTHWMRGEFPEAVHFLEEAMNRPHDYWVPNTMVLCLFRSRNYEKAHAFARNAIDDQTYVADQHLAMVASMMIGMFEYGRYQEALTYFGLADSINGYAYFHVIANVQEGKILAKLGRLEEARQRLNSVYTIDNSYNPFYNQATAWLAWIEALSGREATADSLFRQAVSSHNGNALDNSEAMEETCALYGRFLLDQGRLPEAEHQFRDALSYRNQNSYKGWYGLACLAAKQGNSGTALDYLEKALDNWYPIPGPILKEPLFRKIRKTKRFKGLMAKHFPTAITNH